MSTDDKSGNALVQALAALGNKQQPGGLSPSVLGALWATPEVRGLYYNGKTVTLDGYKFVGCRFDNCVLRVNSTNFELIQCVIDATTRVEYSTSICKLLKLFLGRYHWAQSFFNAAFLPTRNPDGSVTISDRGQ